MPVEAYLMFNGRCEEAIDFYKKSLGAEVLMLMRFKDSPEAPPPGMVPANWDNKVMHSCLRIGDGNVMVSDGCSEAGSFQGFSLSLPASDEADARKKFAALSEGGQYKCRSIKPSGRRASACSRIASASAGWSASRPDNTIGKRLCKKSRRFYGDANEQDRHRSS
jgi:PhnB protein